MFFIRFNYDRPWKLEDFMHQTSCDDAASSIRSALVEVVTEKIILSKNIIPMESKLISNKVRSLHHKERYH